MGHRVPPTDQFLVQSDTDLLHPREIEIENGVVLRQSGKVQIRTGLDNVSIDRVELAVD